MAVRELKNKIISFLEDENQVIFEGGENLIYSREKPGTSKQNCSNIYYPVNHEINSSIEKKGGFFEIPLSSKYDLFCFVSQYYRDKDFLGERKRELVDGKVVFGSYIFKTYAEIKNEIEVFASALCQFENIEPSRFEDNGKFNSMKILGIWSKNRIEWLITDFSCSAIDFVTVPLYDTIGINSVKYIFEKTKMKVCCIESEKLENLISIRNELVHLKFLIIYDEWNVNEELIKKAEAVGYKIYFYKSLIDKYKTQNAVSELYGDDFLGEINEIRKKEGSKKKNSMRDETENGRISNDINSLNHKKNKIRKMSSDASANNKETVETATKEKEKEKETCKENAVNEKKNKEGDKIGIDDIMEGDKCSNDKTTNQHSNEIGGVKSAIEKIETNYSEKIKSASGTHTLKSSNDSHSKHIIIGNRKIKKPTLHDVNSIIFTSGSTGTPKGVMLTHLNFVTFIQSYLIDGNRLGIMKYDSILSYLPLAHAYERYIEYAICFFGAKIGYFSGNIKDILGDINELKPTFLIAVPRVLQKIYDNIMEGLRTKSFLARMLVKTAIKKKKNLYLKNSTKLCHGFYDLILQPIRNRFGGALRIQVMGSSSMDNNKLIDLQMIFSTPISEGWGMSEVGIGFLQNRFDNRKGTIGGPFSNVVMRVSKVEQMKYDPKSYPNRGELCVKGSGVMLGYFRDEALTKKSFDSDGFFLTGDIAEICENGCVKIIDRAKNIFKLSQGEYIEPEKLENIYIDSPYIDQIFVHGYSYENEVVSIIVPSQNNLIEYGKKNNINVPYEDLLKNSVINKLIREELMNVATKYKLNGIEKVHLFHLTSTPFSVENRQLTPTHKIVRNVLVQDYKDVIDSLYNSRKTVK